MRKLLLACAVSLAIAAPALGAPKARTPGECQVFGNMAFIANLMAKHGFAQAQVMKIWPELYSGVYGERPEEAPRLAELIVSFSFRYRRDAPEADPLELGQTLAALCHARRGDLDGILGVDS